MKKILELSTKEANDMLILVNSIDYLFNRLKHNTKNKSQFVDEKVWKNLFSQKVVLFVDDFLTEMAEELNYEYKKDQRIENLRIFVDDE
jgi:hypothetical protein